MRIRFQVRIGTTVSRSVTRAGRSLTIGRNPECDILFSPEESDVVSGEHAKIDVTSKGALLTDLHSTNGTFLDGERVSAPVILKTGQEIRLGAAGPVLKIEEMRGESETPAPVPSSNRPKSVSEGFVPRRVTVSPAAAEQPAVSSDSVNKPLIQLAEAQKSEGPSPTRVLLEDLKQQNQRNWVVAGAVGASLVTIIGVVMFVMSSDVAPGATGDEIFNNTLMSAVWVVNEIDNGIPLLPNSRSTGSGVIVDLKERLVVTNFHVVANGKDVRKEVKVYFPEFRNGVLLTERKEYEEHSRSSRARVLEADETTDLAILQLDWHPKAARAVQLSPNPARAGEAVYTVGNPRGDSLWVHSEGAVRQRQHKEYLVGGGKEALHVNAYVLDTQTPINPGDSGGPVVNIRGELVGINHAHNTRDQLVTHAIDITEVKRVLHKAGSSLGN